MAEGEHPAAKAGRLVRAAARAGAAAAREYESQAAARPTPPAAEPPSPPPALRTNDLLGRSVFVGFLLALVALALLALRSETLFGSHAAKLLRLAAALLLFVEAYLLTSNWQGANQRLGQRLLNRVWGRRAAMTRREKTFARVLRDVLTLVGIAFLAGAVFELLSATIGS